MNLGMPEMIFIFLIALIIFGPKKLPEIGRQVGRALTEFKRASNEFKSQLEAEVRELEFEQNQIAPPPIPPSPEGAIAHEGNAWRDTSFDSADSGETSHGDGSASSESSAAASSAAAGQSATSNPHAPDPPTRNPDSVSQGYDA